MAVIVSWLGMLLCGGIGVLMLIVGYTQLLGRPAEAPVDEPAAVILPD